MSKVITFSRVFPAYHPRKEEPTFFVEKIWEGMSKMDWPEPELNTAQRKWFNANFAVNIYDTKYHTIRSGHRWKAGDKFSPRVWGDDINPKSGRSGPYHSKQIIIAPDIEIKKVWKFEIAGNCFRINEKIKMGESESDFELLDMIAVNDGLNRHDLLEWFRYPKPFSGQIICWNENIIY